MMNLRIARLDRCALRCGIAAACGLLAIVSAATTAVRAAVPCSTVYIPNPEPAVADRFGWSVAISGDVAVVGAEQDDLVNGTNAGSIYVYRSNGSAWLLDQAIPNPTTFAPTEDNFGDAVAVDGDVVVAGAPDANPAGSASVYRYNGSAWLLEQTILNPAPLDDDDFGESVGVSGDVIVVGADGDNPVGVNNAGSAYVYRYDGSAWQLDATIPNPAPVLNDAFGRSAAVSGDVMVIGAPQDNPGDVNSAGTAFIYRYNGSAWLLDLEIANPEPEVDDLFCDSVAIDGNVVVVGVPVDDPNDKTDAGSVYVYRYNGSAWLLDQAIPNPETVFPESDNFGQSVGVAGDVAVIGADDVQIDVQTGFLTGVGEVYMYQYNGAAWALDEEIPNPDPVQNDNFGWSVGVSGGVMVVGVRFDDPEGLNDAGSAYVFGCAAACCAGDFDGDNVVTDADVPDFVAALLAGAACPAPPACCPGDFTSDGLVDGSDQPGFLAKLFSGGACP